MMQLKLNQDLQDQVDNSRKKNRTTYFSRDRTQKPYSWKRRTRSPATVGRIMAANIKQGDRYYWRCMLLERPRMTCRDDFYLWEGRRYTSYRGTHPPHNACFFVQAASGTGKTTLYHTVS